ncbi:hypothetical protein LMG28688_05738 [Paraburkholderia caffeinitolerans]|uniref:DUF3304 domain-containing protein n=1 Tax=Paraburkholderia caffeinitolerans TaxID=1723730 RepID=A0A6J5GQB4_9BURK|nr:DUF3304 domain-containing protein [Paraburkholderia caffeinitolerans]CAB3803279.1 hypothetical protein LMG28688_05738 [Paraburkholderia caffeinitolerans]
MTNRKLRAWRAAFGVALLAALTACQSAGKEERFGYGMGGIDHLADNLSVTDFWVNGAAGQQAGTGNAGVQAPLLPAKWRPGMTVHVVWDVRDWQHDKGSTYEADVPVEPYPEEGGALWVHFLADGTVRVVVANHGPRAPDYPGPHDPIPRKQPWYMYPARGDRRDLNEQLLDDRIIKQRCSSASDPALCEKQEDEKALDDQRADARRYLPKCASATTGYDLEECKKNARQSMRAARFARRCKAVPSLPECTPKKTTTGTPQHDAGVTGQ